MKVDESNEIEDNQENEGKPILGVGLLSGLQ